LGRAHRKARSGEAVRSGALERQSDPEVRHQCLSFLEQNVFGLDVAMDDSVSVGVVQRARHLRRNPDGFVHGELFLAVELTTEGLAIHVGHHVVEEFARRSGIEERQEVGVLQTGCNADLCEEPLCAEDCGQLRSEDLEGHLAMMLEVLSLIDRGHSAATELPLDHVTVGEGGAESVELLRHDADNSVLTLNRLDGSVIASLLRGESS